MARKIMEATGVDSIVSNPEFLTESKWESDAKHPTLVVIGSDNPKYGDAIRGLYEARWKGVQIYQTDTVTSETIKYALNTFFVTKVVFANHLFDLCQISGANYETVKKVLEFYPEGSKNHFTIWHKGGRGAGGKCLAKDLDAFVGLYADMFFTKIHEFNQELLKKYPKTQ
jgi:UDP-glucose 6-dehydrogenase